MCESIYRSDLLFQRPRRLHNVEESVIGSESINSRGTKRSVACHFLFRTVLELLPAHTQLVVITHGHGSRPARVAPHTIVIPEANRIDLGPNAMVKQIQRLFPSRNHQAALRSPGLWRSRSAVNRRRCRSCRSMFYHPTAQLFKTCILRCPRSLFETHTQSSTRLEKKFARYLVYGTASFLHSRFRFSYLDAAAQVRCLFELR